MHITGRRLGRIAAGFATVATMVAGGAPIASGAGRADAEVPEVSINPEWSFVVSETYRDCDGTTYEVGTFGAVVLERTEVDGDVAELEVPVTYGGTLAASLIDPQPVATFDDPAWTEAEVYFELPDATPGTLTITLDEPGVDAGYELSSDPEARTIELTVPGEEYVTDCRDPLEADPERTDQTITVGETPEPLGLFDFDFDFEDCDVDECELVECEDDACGTTATTSPARAAQDDIPGIWDIYSTPVIGTLPPGLTYADDTWTGKATTPGVFTFEVRLCLDLDPTLLDRAFTPATRRVLSRARAIEDLPTTICLGTEAMRIEVLAAADRPTRPAPPATPVRARARFTG